MADWFKVQTPLWTSESGWKALIYNEDRSKFSELNGYAAKKLIKSLNMQKHGDKRFVKGTISAGQFIVNKSTLTREEKF